MITMLNRHNWRVCADVVVRYHVVPAEQSVLPCIILRAPIYAAHHDLTRVLVFSCEQALRWRSGRRHLVRQILILWARFSTISS
jgi:hypothetical protein